MKKILLLILTIVVMLSVFTVPAFAEEVAEEQTVSEVIYGFYQDNASEIYSALSFLGAVILAIFYKKGLLPAVNKAVKTLGEHLQNGITEAKGMAVDTDETVTKFMLGIQPVIEKLEGVPELVQTMCEKNELLEVELKKATTEKEILAKALKSESAMFYELFMSSNLPQFQKDNVSKKKAEIDSLIEVLENADEVRDS